MGARREVLAAVAERYRFAGRSGKVRILDDLCATTGWHRKHAVRALSAGAADGEGKPKRRRRRRYEGVSEAPIALWEASDRACGKRLKGKHPAKTAGVTSQAICGVVA